MRGQRYFVWHLVALLTSVWEVSAGSLYAQDEPGDSSQSNLPAPVVNIPDWDENSVSRDVSRDGDQSLFLPPQKVDQVKNVLPPQKVDQVKNVSHQRPQNLLEASFLTAKFGMDGSLAEAQNQFASWYVQNEEQYFQQGPVQDLRYVATLLQDPVQPAQPVQPIIIDPVDIVSVTGDLELLGAIGWGGPATSTADLPAERRQVAGGDVGTDIVLGSEATVRGAADVGDLLFTSMSNTNIYNRQVSPVLNDTRIRSYRYGQIRTSHNGAFYFPVRPDLDTPMSRFDASTVSNVVILKGPYSVRLGPGFAFMDVASRSTPRHSYGHFVDGLTKFTYNGNGKQWYVRQAFQGGSANQGWRIGYGHWGGSNYQDGLGNNLAAGYEVRDWDFAYGIDLGPDSSLEFTYLRNDLTNVKIPSQVNDLRFLKSNGLGLRYVLENQCCFNLLTVDAWYNDSEFGGTDEDKFFAGPAGLITTNGENSSTGVRPAVTWGEAGCDRLTVGAEFTQTRQGYLEDDTPAAVAFVPERGVPTTKQTDAGFFVDGERAVNDRLTLRAGGRISWLHSNLTGSGAPGPTVFNAATGGFAAAPFAGLLAVADQNFVLGAGYLTAEYELNCVWTADAGAAYAERAPTATDLYADIPFLGVLQNPFFLPIGDALLAKERNTQIDAGLTAEYDSFRGGIRGYYAWIDDFITYAGLTTVNNDATFYGGEVWGEQEVNDWLTAFGALYYTAGQDNILSDPVWGIAPLEARLGLRLQDSCGAPWGGPRWGLEYAVRIVDNQKRNNTTAGFFVGFFESTTPSFTVHDIRGYYRIGERVSLVGAVENLGNELYREHLNSTIDFNSTLNPNGVTSPGFSASVGIEATY